MQGWELGRLLRHVRQQNISEKSDEHNIYLFFPSQQAQEQKVQRFRENHAAKKIQNEWLGYRHRRHEEDVDDVSTLA